ncbi:hypothetical protein BRD00_13015 [Halobacteriales archaeon QS_8_69_26]|nr:MAG: hypothetical protein BRD00_13015 [Halobacteriales archaeon QS_8_69_26]
MSGSLTDALRETLALFDESGEPLTTPEAADRLDLGRRSTYERLERLAEYGRIETKKVGANARVWWRPTGSAGGSGVHPELSVQFRSLVEAVEEYAIFMLDPDGDVVSWNPGAERIRGYAAEEILGEHFSTFYTEADRRAGVPGENLAAAAEEGSVEDEGWRVRKDGSRFRAHVTLTAIREDGDLQGFAKVTRDTTERHEFEERLRRERDLVERILETAPVGIGVLSTTGEVLRTNDRADELLDAGDDGAEGMDAEQREIYDADGNPVPPDERPVARVVETGEPVFDWQCQIEYDDGDRRWLSVNAVPMGAEDGEIRRVVVAGENVTQLTEQARRIERQRDDLEAELAAVFDRVEDGFLALDGEWRFTYVNERAAEVFRHPERDLVGRRIWATIPGADDALGDHLRRAVETGEPVSSEVFFEPLERWLEVNVYPSESGVSVYFRDVTDRERDLDRYETIVESVDEGVYVVDRDRNLTWVNGPYADMLGYSREELIGTNASELVADVSVIREAEAVEEEHGPDSVPKMELELVASDGERVPVEVRSAALPEREGSDWFRVGIVRDIGERRRREHELRDAKLQVEAATEAADIVTWEWNIQEDELVGDPSMARTFGVDPDLARDGLPLERFVSAIHEDDRDRVDRLIDEAVESCGEYEAEYRVRTRDDELRWVIARGQVECDEEGTARTFPGALVDITDRKERQRELDESRRRLRTLVDNFPNGAVTLVDRDLRYVTVGGKLVRELDRTTDELEGTRVPEKLPEELARHLLPSYEAALEGECVSFETSVGDRVYDFTVLPVRDDDGEVVAAMGMSQDVTERTAYERELERQRERLATLNDLNDLFREITDAAIEQSTRDEVEEIVCDRLVEADPYGVAWIGELDPGAESIVPRVQAGAEGDVEALELRTDPDDPVDLDPAARAVRTRELQVSESADRSPQSSIAGTAGHRSAAWVPIVHEDTLYGLLGVYADRAMAFDGDERDVIAQLGEVVGHAIAAVERKQALLSDEVTEIEFTATDVLDTTGIDPGDEEGEITIDRMVPIGDGTFLEYGTVDGDAVQALETYADRNPHFEDLRLFDRHGDGARFELRVTDPPVASVVASHGGHVQRATIADGDIDMTIHLPPTVAPRRVVEAVREAHPSAELLTRRRVTREDRHARIHRVIEDLTDRQRTALEAALYAGFFEWPRETTGEEVAGSLGVAAPTFHQHLRKAQRKVFESVFAGHAGS